LEPTDFPRSPSQVVGAGFWNVDDRRFGLMEYRAFKRMHVIQASGVSGASPHYFNVHILPPASGSSARPRPARQRPIR
jgi:hypothetical protein